MADPIEQLTAYRDLVHAVIGKDTAGSSGALTKAPKVKYSGAESKALAAARDLESAIDSLITAFAGAGSTKSAATRVKLAVGQLELIQKQAKAKAQGAITNAGDLKSIGMAVDAGKKALALAAPGGTSTTIDAATEAETLAKIIPPDLGKPKSLASRLKGALTTGNPNAIAQIEGEINLERSKHDLGSPGYDIADALLSLIVDAPPRPDYIDPDVWEHEKVEASSAVNTVEDTWRKLSQDRTLRSLAAQVVILMWRISRNPADTIAKEKLQGTATEPGLIDALRSEAKTRKGSKDVAPLTDLANTAEELVESIRDDGCADWMAPHRKERFAPMGGPLMEPVGPSPMLPQPGPPPEAGPMGPPRPETAAEMIQRTYRDALHPRGTAPVIPREFAPPRTTGGGPELVPPRYHYPPMVPMMIPPVGKPKPIPPIQSAEFEA